ncbi:MAG: response regulator [Gemmatimonadales bacterium]
MMKALVIEDDAVARLVLKRLLTRFFPHNVLEAEDGEAGWAVVEQERPAVIFCDMFMPNLDGVGFLQRLRAHPELKDTALIAITSAQEPEFVRQLIQLGVADYLVKPIGLEATVHRLEKLLPGLLTAARAREAAALAVAARAAAAAAKADAAAKAAEAAAAVVAAAEVAGATAPATESASPDPAPTS